MAGVQSIVCNHTPPAGGAVSLFELFWRTKGYLSELLTVIATF